MLLARIQSGSGTAFIEAYDFFAPKLYRHALFRTSSPEVADDIASETFVRAWEVVREKSTEIRHLKAFLYRIADNLIIDHYRKNSRAAVPISEEIEETLRAPGDPHERLDRTLAGEKMARFLAQLRPETRDLLVMRYIDDLPIEHIAEATGKKKNAVYVAIHRAVKELKNLCAGTPSDN
ncbi:MAG: RNA polymerase sigma factor [Patescibacteria group bacterium]